MKKHYLRYVDDPILTDTKSKQSSKLASRIGKVRSWKPPKSFLPLSVKKRMSIGTGKHQTGPERKEAQEGSDSNPENELKKEYLRQSNIDYSHHKPWQSILKGFSTLKSEAQEQRGTKQHRDASPSNSGTGTDLICDFHHDDDGSCEKRGSNVQTRRISCNSAGSEVVW